MRLCQIARFCAFLRLSAIFCAFLCVVYCQNGLHKSTNLRRIVQKCAKTLLCNTPFSSTPFCVSPTKQLPILCAPDFEARMQIPSWLWLWQLCRSCKQRQQVPLLWPDSPHIVCKGCCCHVVSATLIWGQPAAEHPSPNLGLPKPQGYVNGGFQTVVRVLSGG